MKSQRATIVSLDHLNNNFEVKVISCPTGLEAGDNGKVLLPMPREKLGEHFETGDEIEFKGQGELDVEIINLSCEVLRPARLKRELNSILRRLDNIYHPLKRCVLLHEYNCVLLSFKEFEKLKKN